MELKDYLTALRRYWLTLVAVTLLALGVAVTALAATPPTYEASARVFIAASPSIPNSAQFVNQRAKSYPDVAESQAVLGPVIRGLGLDTTAAALRSRVSATNPADTSQIEVLVTGRDAAETAEIANAVAEQLTTVVEDLETPSSGDRPVRLTLTDPAEEPTSPVSPVTTYVLALGLVIGLLLGAAAAVTRSRLDSRLYNGLDLRRAWGDAEVDVLVPHRGRQARGALTGNPARALAHRLELAADQEAVRVVLLSVAPRELGIARAFADELVSELRSRGMTAAVSGLPDATTVPEGGDNGRVRIDIVTPLTPLRFWRHVAARYEGVVPLVTPGKVDAAELREVRNLLESASLTPLALVLTGRGQRSASGIARIVAPARRSAGDAAEAQPVEAPSAEIPPPPARGPEATVGGSASPLRSPEVARPVVTARVAASAPVAQQEEERPVPAPPHETHLPKRKHTTVQRRTH